MNDEHLTRELFRAIARGERNPGDASARAIHHLRQLCPRCAAELDAFDRERQESGEPMVLDYGQAYERAMLRVEREAPELERQRAAARPRLEALMALPPAERLEAVQAGDGAFRGAVLAGLLLEECCTCLPGLAQESYALAQLARVVLLHSELTPVSVELYARTLAYQANALRAQGELVEAANLFAHARFLQKIEGGGDLQACAELDRLEGSLLRAQRKLPQAAGLLNRALTAYRHEHLPREEAQTLLKLSLVHGELGELDEALAATVEALKLIDPASDIKLFAMARHNLADRLTELGRYTEARDILLESFEACQRLSDPVAQLRRLWLDGKIARGLGETIEAEQAFLAVRDGFIRQGIGIDAALASLDLATLYLEQGRNAEVKLLADGMVPIFAAQDVHREATAALMLFQEAARREEMTTVFVREVFAFLEAARMDPGLRFSRRSRG